MNRTFDIIMTLPQAIPWNNYNFHFNEIAYPGFTWRHTDIGPILDDLYSTNVAHSNLHHWARLLEYLFSRPVHFFVSSHSKHLPLIMPTAWFPCFKSPILAPYYIVSTMSNGILPVWKLYFYTRSLQYTEPFIFQWCEADRCLLPGPGLELQESPVIIGAWGSFEVASKKDWK